MVDYEYKSLVLQSGLCDLRRKVDYALYLRYYNLKDDKAIPLDEAEFFRTYYYGVEEWLEAYKINKAYYQRVKRLKERIASIIAQPSNFITLTFSPSIMASTSAETRRKYVTRYLRDNFPMYVANIDFGKEHGREHYHAIIQSQSVDYSQWHKLGGVKGEKIVVDDTAALSKYVAKLTNHAIKETAKRTAIIYSR